MDGDCIGYKDLCAAVLFNIASFALGDLSLLDDPSIKQAAVEDFDSDNDETIPETYSDIEESSDEDGQNVDVDDGFEFDDYWERRYDREAERHFRREHQARDNLLAKDRRFRAWRQKMNQDLSKAKRDVKSIIIMMSVCSDWRKELSLGGDSYVNDMWKNFIRRLHPPGPGLGGICIDNILENRGYSFFSIFQIMVRITLFEDRNNSRSIKRQKRAEELEGIALEAILSSSWSF